jgi:cell division septum initiation protein DivIVA
MRVLPLMFFLYHRDMNEELAMQHSVQNQLQPEPNRNPWPKRILMTVVVLVLIGGIGYGTAYAWRQYTDVKNDLSSEQAKNKELSDKNAQLKKDIANKSTTPDLTATLPNGKKIIYPDTPGNRNILWWSMSPTEVGGDSIVLSHKAYEQYVNSTDTGLLDAVCGTDDNPKTQRTDLYYGLFDTTTKKVTPPQVKNCLSAMASTDNTDTVSRAAAQKVLDEIKADSDAFTQDAIIQ